MSNAVMFTLLPSGIVSATASGTVASFSVFVTPQVADPSLASVPAFLDWPATIGPIATASQFFLQFGTTASNAITAVATLDPKYAANRFDSKLWKSIFGAQATAPITPWAVKDYTTSGVLSFGAKKVSSAVKSMYKAAAPQASRPTVTATGTDELSVRTLDIAAALPHGQVLGTQVKATMGQKVGGLPQTALSGQVLSTLQTNGTLPAAGTYNRAETPEFIRAAAFHNRNNYRDLTPAPPTNKPSFDFHSIVGHLADHPVILRRLGLVLDFTFVVPAGIDGFTSIFVNTTAAVNGLTVNHPWTYCVLHPYGSSSPATFRPFYGTVDSSPGYPQTPSVHPLVDNNGLVRLDDNVATYLDDLDVDHAVVHVSHYAEKVHADLAAKASVSATLPALRSSGFSLHHYDREGDLGLHFNKTLSWNPNGTTFAAEDFIRGYRVDVRTVNGAVAGNWSSLCLRQTTFTFTDGTGSITVPAPGATDEGFVKAGAMTAANTDALYNLGESLFHWDGWSLVASRPGLSVGAPTGAPGDGPVTPQNSGAGLNLPFTTSIVPQPGSLTKLRFGTSYQFRVRAVDLAGNDLLAANPSNTLGHPSPVTPFLRYEPVSPPVLQLRRAVTEGESVERLVIRSDPYAPTPVYAADWAAQNASLGMNLYNATCERHVAPPKTSMQIAEYHGAFDSALSNVPAASRPSASWAIATKEEGSFYDSSVTDSTTGQYRTVQQPGRSIVTPPGSQAQVALALASGQPVFTGTQDITPRGTSLIQGQYVIFDADQLTLPYLPDPNAAGVVFQGLAATPQVRTYGARAANPSGGNWPELAMWRLVLQESRSGLTYSGLDPASAPTTPVTVSLPPATELPLTYSSTLFDATAHAFGPPSKSDPSYASAQQGLLPILSPSRTVTLVHAVQRPKAPGLLDGDIGVAPRNEGETAQTVSATIRFDGASSGRVDLVASWSEIVDQANAANPTADPSANPIPHVGAIATLTPNPGDTSVFKTLRQLFGDTKRRDITFSTVATTRFREYFPASITSDVKKITNTTALPSPIICKSSARPPIPRVLYAVPSFIFTPNASGSTTSRKRSGGTVRVYVDRGWFATGTDERLGVVLAPQSQPTNTTGIPAMGQVNPSSIVSVWGTDPIWHRGTLTTLDASHVSPATVIEIVRNQPLLEGGGVVDVATYRPNFNSARGLWYFDIELTTDQAYFPFLRLALTRFQPQSIGNLQMSQVVTTDFVQLPADRTASVVDMGGGNYNVSLQGPTAPNLASPDPNSPASMASGHTVTVEFQQALTANPDAMDWTTIGDITVLPPSAVSGASVTYQASVAYPSYAAVPGAKHRILFREYEVYATDGEPGVQQGRGIVQIGANMPTSVPYTQRLVYADTIALNV